MTGPQTPTQALTLALWLAVTAPDDKRSDECLAHAEASAAGLSLEQVREAQDAVDKVLEGAA